MRRLALLATLLAGCDAQAGIETTLAFAVLFGTLARIFVDPDAR
jgi:hypothetical protein